MRFNLDKPFRTKIDGAILLGKTIIDQPMGSEQKKNSYYYIVLLKITQRLSKETNSLTVLQFFLIFIGVKVFLVSGF